MFKIRYAFLLCTLIPCSIFGQVEICDNGIDDDNDSAIDFNDDDCVCQITTSTSLIPNPSFEDLDCCPSDRSQLYCATDWIQASTPTTDFIHLCDWAGIKEYPAPLPFPDGDGILGFRDGRIASSDTLDAYWKEYAGACLTSPLKADSSYRFQFDIGFVNPQASPPINVSLFGTADCAFLPFGLGDAAFGCPSNSPEWVRLGDVMVDGGDGDVWIRSFIDVVPDMNINAIAIGPDCAPRPTLGGIYYYFDNLQLTDLAAVDLRMTEIGHPCDDNFRLSVPNNLDFEYQWYLSGVALQGEVFSELQQNYGAGPYQIRILSGSSCRISSPYDYVIPSYDISDTIAICEGDSYTFGNQDLTNSGFYMNTFFTEFNCDSLVSLKLDVIGETFDTVEVSVAPGEVYQIGNNSFTEEGEFEVTLTSSLGCDSLVYLKLNHFNVYIPTIFSPNADGVNDLFVPFYDENEVVFYDMKIYNRWGNLIYEGDAWDGRNLSTDIYVYLIDVQFNNGVSTLYRGTVTLLE